MIAWLYRRVRQLEDRDESPLFLHYDHRELAAGTDNSAPLGYIVENRVLRRALLARAAALPSWKLLAPQTVTAMEASETGATVTLVKGEHPLDR